MRLALAYRGLLPALLVLALSGCNPAPPGVEFWDPFEERNRRVHERNLAADALFFDEEGNSIYQARVPAPVRRGIANFSANSGEPSNFVNAVLQGRPGNALSNLFRFLINTSVGFGGLVDVASDMGLPPARTDFGETLHVWGFAEGAYLELRFLGPTTERDLAGTVIDILIDPLNYISPTSTRNALLAVRFGAWSLSRIDERAEYSDFFDALIGESAESYVQLRNTFLQFRRFQLEGLTEEEEIFDPYE